MKLIVCLFAAVAVISTAEAAQKGGKGKMTERQRQKQQEKQQRDAERDKKRDAVKELLDEKDGNNDGSLTRDEYLVGESDVEAAGKRFDDANKNGDRYLSKKEMEVLLGV